jgi:hypothetical protein
MACKLSHINDDDYCKQTKVQAMEYLHLDRLLNLFAACSCLQDLANVVASMVAIAGLHSPSSIIEN